MSQPSHCNLLPVDEPEFPVQIALESGDVVTLDVAGDGSVLLVLDDVDDTTVPTARLERAEAASLAAALTLASARSRGR